MATIPNTLSPTEYWMSPEALTIELNALDNPQYLQVSLLAGSVIMAYRQDIISFDASLNYRKWNIQAYNNFFDRTDRAYVYARLNKDDNTALITYSYDMLELEETITDDSGSALEVYNVYLGTISSAVNSSGATVPRTWESPINTGNLNTDQYKQEEQLGEWSKMFRLNKVTDMIEVLKDMTSAVIHKLYIGARKIMINDVQTSSEEDSKMEPSDSVVPTTKFLDSSFSNKYLSRIKEDYTNYLIKFFGGIVTDNIASKNLVLGPLGTGLLLKVDPETGRSYIEVDELYVRLKAYFDTLEIKHISHVGGTIIVSPASMECTKVELINLQEGDPLYDSLNSRLSDINSSNLFAKFLGKTTESVYRCYFNNTDGTKEIINEFAVDDLAQCRTFNIKEGVSENVSNQYYWRRVVSVGDNYIDLSVSDCDPLSTVPQAGDTIVTVGNKTDVRRQNVIMLMSFGEGSPAIYQYSGINSYSLEGKAKTIISPERNEFRGTFYFESGENIKEFITAEDEKIKTETSESILQILPDKITLEVSKQISTVVDDVDTLKTQVASLEVKSDEISLEVSSIESTANSAYSTANSAYNKATSAQSTANSAYNKAEDAESSASSAITQISSLKIEVGSITSTVSKLEDGNELVSIINQTSTTIKLSAQKINLSGAISANGTFSISTAGNITCTGGTIGGFTIKSNSITCDGRGSSLSIGVDGGRFFRVNANGSTGSMCAIRADSATCLALSTYGTNDNCIGLSVTCNGAGYGYAIKAYGNVLLSARRSENIRIEGLCIATDTIGSSTTIPANYDFMRFTNSSAITVNMPPPVAGKILFHHYSSGTVTLARNGASAFRRADNVLVYSNYVVQKKSPRIWICDGMYWHEFYCNAT